MVQHVWLCPFHRNLKTEAQGHDEVPQEHHHAVVVAALGSRVRGLRGFRRVSREAFGFFFRGLGGLGFGAPEP